MRLAWFTSSALVVALALAGCGGGGGNGTNGETGNGNGGSGNGDGSGDQSAQVEQAEGEVAEASVNTASSPDSSPAPENASTDDSAEAEAEKTDASASETKADDGNGDDGEDQQKAEVDKVIEITGNDKMKYNIDSFTVKAGSKIKIDFEHVGKMPRAAMGHNVVIVKQGVQPIAFAGQCVANGGNLDNGYVPEKKKIQKKIIAYTDLVGGGKTTSVTFTVPKKTGNYPFLCTFPAHAASSMKGTMKVK